MSEVENKECLILEICPYNKTERLKKVKLSSIYGRMLKDLFMDDVINNIVENEENGNNGRVDY